MVKLMSAREKLYVHLTPAFGDAEFANGLLDAYAHELAEQIRAELAEQVKEIVGGGWAEIRTVYTAQHAADLIDPEVQP